MKSNSALVGAIGFASSVVWIAAFVSAAAASAPDDPRTKVIAELRAFKEFPSKSLWSPAQLRAKIGMAQVDVRDFEGARETLKTIFGATARDQYYQNPLLYHLIKNLAVAEAADGDLEAAKRTLKVIHGESQGSYYCQDVLSVAHAAAKAGKKNEASAELSNVAEMVSRLKDDKDKRSGLFQLATTQITMGFRMHATRTTKSLEELTAKLGDDDWYRAYALLDLARLFAELSDQVAAKRHFAEAVEAAKRHKELEFHVRQQVAVEIAESGDVPAAIELALTIPDVGFESADRGRALGAIACIQLKNGDRPGAEATAQKIKHWLQYQSGSLLKIVEAYARLGESKKAIATAGTIKDDSRKAQAMLTVAAIVAERGDKKAALKIAEGLTYPTSQFPLPSGGQFVFGDPKSWGNLYEMGFAFTMTSFHVAKDTAADLTAAAMRCRVAVIGQGDITYSEELEQWDARKVAKAQALAGDAAGAFQWVERLTAENRLEGLCGITEGIAALTKANESR
jgi:hypothetical protein